MSNVHSKFCAPDADIAILSSDRVLFRIHSINLRANSTAFPEEIASNRDDPATFSEPSNILELLFAFLYPSPPHPTLTDLSFDVLKPLAYAAHKYGVASAIGICDIRMVDSTENRRNHPIELLEYVCRYMPEEEKKAEEMAAISLGGDTVHAMEILDADVFAAWVLYRERISRGWGPSNPARFLFKECLFIVRAKRG